MLLLKIVLGLVGLWTVICIAGYGIFLLTDIEWLGYPICWTITWVIKILLMNSPK